MGYESTLIIATTHPQKATSANIGFGNKDFFVGDEDVTWIHPIATFDLSKMGSGPFAALVEASPKAERAFWYVHLASGSPAQDTTLRRDPYGDAPTRLDFADTIRALKASDQGYRRIAAPLAALEAFHAQLADGFWASDQLALFHIGH